MFLVVVFAVVVELLDIVVVVVTVVVQPVIVVIAILVIVFVIAIIGSSVSNEQTNCNNSYKTDTNHSFKYYVKDCNISNRSNDGG